MRSTAIAWLLLLIAVACAEREPWMLTWPLAPDAETAIMLTQTSERSVGEVIRVQDGLLDRGRAQLELRDDLSLRLLLYARAPSELGLEVGPLEPRAEGVLLTDPRTGFSRQLELTGLTDDARPAWMEAADEPSTSFRLSEQNLGCPEFEIELLENGLSSDPLLLEVNEAGQYRVLFREGMARLYSGESVPLVDYQLLAAAAIGGRWWVMDGYANLYELDPNVEASSMSLELLTYGDMSEGYWIAGHHDEERTEIYTLAQSGKIELWDGSSRRAVHQLPASMVEYHDRAGGLAWLGPGHVLAGWASSPDVVSVRDGVISTEITGATRGLVSLRGLASGRVAAGDAVGGLYLRALDGTWTALPGNEIKLWPLTFAERGESLVYATALGALGAYRPGFGYCAPLYPYMGATFRALTVAGDAIYLAGAASGGGVILRVRPR